MTIIISRIFVKCESWVTTVIEIRINIAKWLKYEGKMHDTDASGIALPVRFAVAFTCSLGLVELESLAEEIELKSSDVGFSDEANCKTRSRR